jgi:hypothetical protein
MTEIRCDLNRRMDSAKLWLNNAEDETAIRNTADSNISNDAKLPEPVLPSPEPQQQQIQQNNDDVGSAATKDSNNNNGVANNDSNQSLVSPPHPRPNVDIILSLKDPIYSSVMMECFQMMGNKNDNTASEEDAMKSVVSKKALLHFKGAERDASLTFKDRNTIGETMTVTNTSTVRFFKPESRHKVDRTFVMVDEKAALRSKFIVYPTVHSLSYFLVCFLLTLCISSLYRNYL